MVWVSLRNRRKRRGKDEAGGKMKYGGPGDEKRDQKGGSELKTRGEVNEEGG